MPSTLMKTDNINGLVFADNTIDAGNFFDGTSKQGKLRFGEYCSNITYTDNIFVNSGFLRNREIAESDSVCVWAQINSQL